jgi:hypothetical protein
LNFRVEAAHPEHEQVKLGRVGFFVEWFQTVRTFEMSDCPVTVGYYSYAHYDQQKNPAIPVEVAAQSSDRISKLTK